VIENPTWAQVCDLADDMIKTTGDFHHVFLEGVRILSVQDEITTVDFCMGS
jgi:hypothetical protein